MEEFFQTALKLIQLIGGQKMMWPHQKQKIQRQILLFFQVLRVMDINLKDGHQQVMALQPHILPLKQLLQMLIIPPQTTPHTQFGQLDRFLSMIITAVDMVMKQAHHQFTQIRAVPLKSVEPLLKMVIAFQVGKELMIIKFIKRTKLLLLKQRKKF